MERNSVSFDCFFSETEFRTTWNETLFRLIVFFLRNGVSHHVIVLKKMSDSFKVVRHKYKLKLDQNIFLNRWNKIFVKPQIINYKLLTVRRVFAHKIA